MEKDKLYYEIERLKHDYFDLKNEIKEITEFINSDKISNSRKRGIFTSAGATCEGILKYILKKENLDSNSKPADKFMLDELLTKLSSHLPPQVMINFRTIQAWRNLGTHDKEDLRTIDQNSFIQIDMALNNVIQWFFNSVLKIDAELKPAENPELSKKKAVKSKISKEIKSIIQTEEIQKNKEKTVIPESNLNSQLSKHIKGRKVRYGKDELFFVEWISDAFMQLANIRHCKSRKEWNSIDDAKALTFDYFGYTIMFFSHQCVENISNLVNKPQNVCPYEFMKNLKINANAYFLGSWIRNKPANSETEKMLLAQKQFNKSDMDEFRNIRSIIVGEDGEKITGKLLSNGSRSGHKICFWTNKSMGTSKAATFQFRFYNFETEFILSKSEDTKLGLNVFLLNPDEIFLNNK